ncbi:MAG: ABC transporter ATP-binding protein/permease [Clostridia bacterium]|nr:ABC transporter ATP-binding protein/permease [Clostridia bacterium]
MLELKQITKDYITGAETVRALRGIDLAFRDCEFVAVLGPSGCGKTTMLNIIGGLDSYTEGDLSINGRSTKDYSGRDWDAYRNHSVGFVFQTYNLIPHQTVLRNVELALTLSGVPRAERRRRAKEALERVGLGGQLNKRPNEMSGGQMQRVAIARAIVNDPDIVLADEPTGALDTETGIQVMEILKEISKERLVVMVTHNPELAGRYATRTVNMIDGLITGDSDPFLPSAASSASLSGATSGEEAAAGEKTEVDGKTPDGTGKKKRDGTKEKKPSMSIFTSFGLSLNNLFTKKGRTALTSFAGSIGIIGIALIYAVSNGATNYINNVQEETLTAYPLTLESETVELASLIETFLGKAESDREHGLDAIYQKAMVYSLVNSLNSIETSVNDLTAFKSYLGERMADPDDTTGLRDAVSGVQYVYPLDLMVYTESTDGKIIHSDINELMRDLIIKNMNDRIKQSSSIFDTGGGDGDGGSDSGWQGASGFSSMMSSASSYSTLFQEMLPGRDGRLISDVFYSQYDLIYGSWPNDYNEVVLVVDEKNEVADLSLYALGLLPEEDVKKVFDAVADKVQIEESRRSWTYEEICSGDYRVVLPFNCYVYNAETGGYDDLRDTEAGIRYLYSGGLRLRVCGIIRAKESAITTILNGSIGYTSRLTEHILEAAKDSDIVRAQEADPEHDIFSGLMFRDVSDSLTDAEKAAAFRKRMSELPEDDKAAVYVNIMSIPTDEFLDGAVDAALSAMSRADMEASLEAALKTQMSVDAGALMEYVKSMSDEELHDLIAGAMKERIKEQYAQNIAAGLAAIPKADLAASLDAAIGGYTDEMCAKYYAEVADTSGSTYGRNMRKLGCIDPDEPSAINIFSSTFENKDTVKSAIDAYNGSVDDAHEIKYTDFVGLMMSSITTIINAITYVLIGFVAISLFVSSIMIGVITLISVQERTKEIGILRAIGASKSNVSSMFSAETVIIGFTAGVIGVAVTYLLCIPINIILHRLTDIENLSASLPVPTALILIAISIVLTLISGIIPSVGAAMKNPAVALRTE